MLNCERRALDPLQIRVTPENARQQASYDSYGQGIQYTCNGSTDGPLSCRYLCLVGYTLVENPRSLGTEWFRVFTLFAVRRRFGAGQRTGFPPAWPISAPPLIVCPLSIIIRTPGSILNV